MPAGASSRRIPRWSACSASSAPRICSRCRPPSQLYVDPADRERVVAALHEDGMVRSAEYELRRRDGQIITVVENARVLRDADGAIIGYEGTLADISKRKAVELQLSAEKEKAQVTLQSIGDAVLTADADGRGRVPEPGRRGVDRMDDRRGAGAPGRRGIPDRQRGHATAAGQPDPALPARRPHRRARRAHAADQPHGCRRSRSRTRPPRSATAPAR